MRDAFHLLPILSRLPTESRPNCLGVRAIEMPAISRPSHAVRAPASNPARPRLRVIIFPELTPCLIHFRAKAYHRQPRRRARASHAAWSIRSTKALFPLTVYPRSPPSSKYHNSRGRDGDRFYRRGRAPAWFDLDRRYFLMGGCPGSEARGYRELMGEEDPERYDEVRSLAQTFKGGEDFAAAAMRIVEVPEFIRRCLSVEQIARAVPGDLKLDLQSLRTPSRHADASRARALTAYLGKLYGRIPFARTAEFFNRSGASIARDVLHLDQSLRDSKELQRRVDNLARRLTKTG